VVGARRQTVVNWLREHGEEFEKPQGDGTRRLARGLLDDEARIERLSTRLEHITAEVEKR